MNRRHEAARQRADLAFILYFEGGPERSLERLADHLKLLGAPISVATLKRYSRDYGWQQRLAEVEAKTAQRQTEASIRTRLAMFDRHAQVARAMLGAGGTGLQGLLNNATRTSEMTPAEIVRLVEAGLKAELRAAGAVTDRLDIATEIWNDVTVEVVRIFQEGNDDIDPDARARLFAAGIDRLATSRLSEIDGGDHGNGS